MSKLDKEQVIEKFTAAYKAANGKAPKLEAKGGWYSVDGGKNMRLAQLEELADSLTSGGADKAPAKAKKTEKPAEKKAASSPEKAKPAAKKAAAPAKAKKTKKAKNPDFSVKALWAEQLASNDPNSRLPR